MKASTYRSLRYSRIVFAALAHVSAFLFATLTRCSLRLWLMVLCDMAHCTLRTWRIVLCDVRVSYSDVLGVVRASYPNTRVNHTTCQPLTTGGRRLRSLNFVSLLCCAHDPVRFGMITLWPTRRLVSYVTQETHATHNSRQESIPHSMHAEQQL